VDKKRTACGSIPVFRGGKTRRDLDDETRWNKWEPFDIYFGGGSNRTYW